MENVAERAIAELKKEMMRREQEMREKKKILDAMRASRVKKENDVKREVEQMVMKERQVEAELHRVELEVQSDQRELATLQTALQQQIKAMNAMKNKKAA